MSFNETVPRGVDPNYYNETQVPTMIGVGVFLIVLSFIAVGLRFYSRRIAQLGFWWDDWFALSAVPCIAGFIIGELASIAHGNGRHFVVVMNTDPSLFGEWLRDLFAVIVVYNISLVTFKCSALALYYRIFGVRPWLRISTMSLGGLILAWSLIATLLQVFRCRPLAGAWSAEPASCMMNLTQLNLLLNIPTILFSVMTLALPVGILSQLKMHTRHRMGIMAIFLVGGLDLVISILRLVGVVQDPANDLTWTSVSLFYWSAAESAAGLLCCCLPTYAPLLHLLRGNPYRTQPTAEATCDSGSFTARRECSKGPVSTQRSFSTLQTGEENEVEDGNGTN